ncbi:CRISPR-associated protein Cas2 [Vibrio sp. 1-Bac 57]
MANNLFISYDLNSPGQDYQVVIDEIKSLGSWAKVQKSHWYVNSSFTASQALEKVWAKMDSNDSLIVVDATNNNASWQGLLKEVSDHILDQWSK